MENQVSDINQYCIYLEEIKKRLNAIDLVYGQKASLKQLGRDDYDVEFICLQFRKVLELLAFSTIITSKEKYSKYYADHAQHWRAKFILRDVKKINPDFFPKPLVNLGRVNDNEVKLDFLNEGFLSEDDFIYLYDTCSEGLHSINPYTSLQKTINLKYDIPAWIQLITKLLCLHQIKLVDSKNQWIVYFQHPVHGKVEVLTSSPL